MQNQIIVITGASSGFGKGTALELARQGATVVLAARREEVLSDLVLECEAAGGRAVAVPTDVSSAGEVENLTRTTLERFGKIDVWINDAGVGALGRFTDIPLADHEQVIETNLLGTLYGSYFAMKQFRKQNTGILINIASALGKIPTPYYSSYVASKYGVVGLDAVLRQELAEDKIDTIHICTVMPMAMDTPYYEHAANYTGHEVQPVPPLYDAQKVVDTLVRLVQKPEPEVIVGNLGKFAAAMHNVTPGIVEAVMANRAHKVQMEDAALAPDTTGSVHAPMAIGTELHGEKSD